jgi:hypothetical protein
MNRSQEIIHRPNGSRSGSNRNYLDCFFIPKSLSCVLRTILFLVPLVSCTSASAATAYFFKGQCHDSRVKVGTLDADLRVEAGDPIHCETAVLIELKNGRKLMQFLTGLGVLGFAGGTLDRSTNPTLTLLPIDRLYPIRDLGTSSDEQFETASKGEGALDGAEGFCFFEPKDLARVRSLSCVSKYVHGDIRTVHSIQMNVRKVDKTIKFPDVN